MSQRKLSQVINCCPTQVAYIKGHHEEKASMKNTVEEDHTFYVTHRGHCEFCGTEWLAHFSHLTRQIEYRRVTSEEVQDDEG